MGAVAAAGAAAGIRRQRQVIRHVQVADCRGFCHTGEWQPSAAALLADCPVHSESWPVPSCPVILPGQAPSQQCGPHATCCRPQHGHPTLHNPMTAVTTIAHAATEPICWLSKTLRQRSIAANVWEARTLREIADWLCICGMSRLHGCAAQEEKGGRGGMAGGTADPAALLRLYIQHGKLEEATRLTVQSMSAWRMQARPSDAPCLAAARLLAMFHVEAEWGCCNRASISYWYCGLIHSSAECPSCCECG